MRPDFSVLVPVYEQWHLVPVLLERLSSQTMPQQAFEVILADNGSVKFDPPARLPANVRIVSCASPGSYAARNMAAQDAKGTWFAFTDADCQPEPEWLAALSAKAGEARTILVGAVDIRAGALASVYEIYDTVRGIPQERYAGRGYGATANLAVSAALFREVGGFDGTRFSGGDAEFCRRAGSAGAQVQFVAAARVIHPARTTWSELATKARRVLGGQITAGSRRRRFAFLLRALGPPVLVWWSFARARHPLSYRLLAILVQTRLWGVEVLEGARLLGGGQAERR